MAGEAVLLVFALVLFVVLAVVIPLWVYSDAQRNSPHSAVLWALVVFFGGVLGILLYFIIGRRPAAPRSTDPY